MSNRPRSLEERKATVQRLRREEAKRQRLKALRALALARQSAARTINPNN